MTEEGGVRIGAAATALGVSVDTLRRWECDGRVRVERLGGRRVMAPAEPARLVGERAGGGRSSARNRMAGVVGVERDGAMAKVDPACGPFRLVALMSRDAADDLGLEPGATATALVKATNVIVER